MTAKVCQLAYIGATATDLDAWGAYTKEVAGFSPSADSDDRMLYLRVDDRHHRFMLLAGDVDDVAYLGWEVRGHAELEVAAAAVEAAGVEVIAGKAEEAADRRVLEFAYFTCPFSGVRMELAAGHEQIFLPRFRPERDLAGFRTGSTGLGHAVLYAPDVKGAADFYTEVLGFGVSDYAVIQGLDAPLAAFLHCNARHHSLAFLGMPGTPRRIQHVMLETTELDDVGTSYELCREKNLLTTSLGRHYNDRAFSFYFRNPSAWHFEFAWGPREIDPAAWETEQYTLGVPGAYWGHEGLMQMI
jgi:2,3-dihydroxybiphenyl 1,2-dioxygenase